MIAYFTFHWRFSPIHLLRGYVVLTLQFTWRWSWASWQNFFVGGCWEVRDTSLDRGDDADCWLYNCITGFESWFGGDVLQYNWFNVDFCIRYITCISAYYYIVVVIMLTFLTIVLLWIVQVTIPYWLIVVSIFVSISTKICIFGANSFAYRIASLNVVRFSTIVAAPTSLPSMRRQ